MAATMVAVKVWSKLPYAGKQETITWDHYHFQLGFLGCFTERSLVGTTFLVATVLVADLAVGLVAESVDRADAYVANADA